MTTPTTKMSILETLRRQLMTYRNNHVPWKGCLAFCYGMHQINDNITQRHDDDNDLAASVEQLIAIPSVENLLPTQQKLFIQVAWEWLLDLFSVMDSDMDLKYLHPCLQKLQKQKQQVFAKTFADLSSSTSSLSPIDAMNRHLRAAMILKQQPIRPIIKEEIKLHLEFLPENIILDIHSFLHQEKRFQSWMLTLTDPVRWYRSSMMKRIEWEKELTPFPALNYRLGWKDPDLKVKLDTLYSNKLSYGARGASESHDAMWRCHANQKTQCCIKYSEDDMIPSPIYKSTLETLVAALPESKQWDLIWIGYHMPIQERMQAMLNVSSRLMIEGPPPFYIGGMFGYIIPTRESAAKLVAILEKTPKPIDVGVDTWIMQLRERSFKGITFRQAHLNLPILFSQYWVPHQPDTQRSDCGPSWNNYPLAERL